MSQKVQDVNQKIEKPAGQPKQQKLLDHRLMAGPLAERGCTDIIFLVLFICSFIVMWYIAIRGYTYGKPSRLAAVFDPDQKACGLDYPNQPYLYFPILHPDYYNYTTCVAECPPQSIASFVGALNCHTNRLVPSCQKNCFGFDFNDATTLQSFPPTSNVDKLFCIYGTDIMFNRICFPTDALKLLNQESSFSSSVNLDRVTAWFADLKTANGMIIGSFFIAFVLGMVYMILVRYVAGILVWASILLYFICALVLASYCYNRSVYYGNLQTSTANGTNSKDTSQALLIISACLFAWVGLSVIIFICIFNKIRLAIAIIKTATLFVKDNPLIMFVPPIIAVTVGVLWVWWIISTVYVVALGDIKGAGSNPFATVEFDVRTRQMFYYFIFGGLWKNAFLLALCDFIIGSSCCIWYFSRGPGQGNYFPISTSIFRAFRYHLGSLAFGSLILAIIQSIRIMLAYVRWQTKQMSGDNKMTKCLLDCLSCLVACFERFIEFLNKNAYIQIALTGKSFCPAAKEAFETIWANSGRYALVNGIGAAFSFVGKLVISVLTTMIAYLVFITISYYKKNLYSPVVPSIVIFVIAYAVGLLFMTIYSMSCDTVLTCYIYDEELNKQSGGGSAQHCPETLREFFETYDKSK